MAPRRCSALPEGGASGCGWHSCFGGVQGRGCVLAGGGDGVVKGILGGGISVTKGLEAQDSLVCGEIWKRGPGW